MGIVIWLLVGAVAGWLAGMIVKGYGFGLIGNMVVGVIGSLKSFGLRAIAPTRRLYRLRHHCGDHQCGDRVWSSCRPSSG